MKKIEENKQKKKESLLESSFALFMKNGFHNTSISDIVTHAGVAKGTFYLYFKDKYDIRNHLISFKAGQIFRNAYAALQESGMEDFEEGTIFIIDHILGQFQADKSLVLFISKHLSWGLFKSALHQSAVNEDESIYDFYFAQLAQSGYTYRNPELMLYMIIELVSGISYNAVLYAEPMPLDEIKPTLYETVRNIMKQERS